MSILNKLVNHSCKFILVMIGFALVLLPIIHLFGHQRLHHQGWNPAFEKYQHRINEIQDTSALQFGYVVQNNSTQKSQVTYIQDTLELADFVCYNLIQSGKSVVRKNIELKVKRKAKKNQEVQSPQEVATVATLVQNPPLAFLKKEVSKYINFEHQSLKSKHWVIVSFGEVETKIIQEIESIKESNPQYKFLIVSPKQITPLSIQTSSSKPESEQVTQQKEKSKKKKTKVKKVKVVEEEAQKLVQPTQQDKVIQENDL